MRKVLLGAAAIAAVAMTLVAGTPKAHATPTLEYSTNGGANFTTVSLTFNPPLLPGGLPYYSGSVLAGSFAITDISISSNSPGSAKTAEVLGASLDIQNIGGSVESIILAISDTDFTAPVAPPTLLLNSHIGGSIIAGSSNNTTSFTSCVSTTNAHLTSCAGATYVAGPGNPAITSGSFKNDQYANVTSLSSPYSISSIWDLTLGAGSSLNFGANATLSVPEPVTLSVLGTGLVALGIVRRRRRT